MARRRVRRSALILLGIGGVAGLAYLVTLYRVHSSYESQVEGARREGLWPTLADFERASPPIQDSENAGPKYQELARTLGPLAHELVAAGNDSVQDAREEAKFEATYAKASAYLEQFRVAAQLTRCQFQRDWRQGPAMLLPEYTVMRTVLKVVCVKAELLARHGHVREGLDLIAAYAPLAKHVGADPIYFSLHAEDDCDKLVIAALHTILGFHGLEPGVADSAGRVLDRLGSVPDPAWVVKGQGLLFMLAIESFNGDLGDSGHQFDSSTLRRDANYARVPSVREIWMAAALRRSRAQLKALESTPSDLVAASRAWANVPAEEGIAGEYTAFVPPVDANLIDDLQDDIASRRTARQFIVALQGWTKTGRKPVALPLGGDVAIDPRTNKPFLFNSFTSGFGISENPIDLGFAPGSQGFNNGYSMVYPVPPTPSVVRPPGAFGAPMLGGPAKR